METLKQLREYGTSLGLEGNDLIQFIESQQAMQRDERQLEREREKEEREIEKQKLEHEVHMKKLEHAHQLDMLKEQKIQAGIPPQGNVYPSKVTKLPPFEESTDDMDAY